MAQRIFRPVFPRKYPDPGPYDEKKYPYPADAENATFGDLFHRMYRHAVNLYDVARHGPGYQKVAMEAMTNFIIEFLIGTAAWLDGQTAELPSPDDLRAKMYHIRAQAFQYEYNYPDGQSLAVSHLISSTCYWVFPRAYLLHNKAHDLRTETRTGKCRVRVVAEFEIDTDVAALDARQYVKNTVCKEFFAADSVRFLKLKKVDVLTDDTTPKNEEAE